MALQALQIYKHLPKTNCKDCGFLTCLAFAMQLAMQKTTLDRCNHISPEGREILGAESRPAIKLVKVGDREIGNETVLFRHEKAFYHETLLSYQLSDKKDISDEIKDFNKITFDRVGTKLKLDMVTLRYEGDAETFNDSLSKLIKSNLNCIMLECDDIGLVERSAKLISGKGILKPSSGYEEFAMIAKANSLPIVIGGKSIEEIAENTAKVMNITDNIIIEIDFGDFRKNVEALTLIRQISVKHKFMPLGFPTLIKASDIIEAATYMARYASIVVINKLVPEEILPLLTLRQNIFTDPQKPLQVEAGIYTIGAVTKASPVFVTTNFSLTYFIVSSEIGSSKVPAYLLVVDAEGMSVLTGYAADKFTPKIIAKAINKFNLGEKTDNKKIIIPGLISQISGGLEEESSWKVVVGPREAKDIKKFMPTFR